MTKMPLDFRNAVSIIDSSRAPVRLSAQRTVKPGPDAFWRKNLTNVPVQKEVIMTSTREYYGSQDFFALDIPVT